MKGKGQEARERERREMRRDEGGEGTRDIDGRRRGIR